MRNKACAGRESERGIDRSRHVGFSKAAQSDLVYVREGRRVSGVLSPTGGRRRGGTSFVRLQLCRPEKEQHENAARERDETNATTREGRGDAADFCQGQDCSGFAPSSDLCPQALPAGRPSVSMSEGGSSERTFSGIDMLWRFACKPCWRRRFS